jgi:hypothetical protein
MPHARDLHDENWVGELGAAIKARAKRANLVGELIS